MKESVFTHGSEDFVFSDIQCVILQVSILFIVRHLTRIQLISITWS